MTKSKTLKSTRRTYDMRQILNFLRSRPDTHEHLMRYEAKFGAISEDLNIEDMPFYKDYLSKFDTEKELDGVELKWDKSGMVNYKDYDLLQRLVFGSIRVDYKLDFDKEDQTYTLTIITDSESRQLNTLNFIVFGQQFRFFIDEMLVMEIAKHDEESGGRQWVEEQRKIRLKYFERKAEQLRNAIQGNETNSTALSIALKGGKGGCVTEENAIRELPDTYYKVIDGKGIIPIGEKSIPKDAFSGAWHLKSVFIPASVTRIGPGAFYDCKNLETVVIPPDSVKSIGASAFTGCTTMKGIKIPESVTKIGNNAFHLCKSLKSVVIPNSVTIITDYTFCHCGELESVVIGNSVQKIGEGAFDNCKSLETIFLPESLTVIGKRAFEDCLSLESIDLPNSLTEIKSLAFYRCENLISIVIPDSVVKIGIGVFGDCFSLKRIVTSNPELLKSAWLHEGVEIVKP